MSLNRRKETVLRVLLVAIFAASVSACASSPPPKDQVVPQGPTPTEQFTATVDSHRDQILLAAHAEGLSTAQATALSDLVDRWRDNGGGPITVQAPSHGGGESYRSAMAIQGALTSLGVRETLIKLTGYEASTAEGAPVVVSFASYEARPTKCGQDWDAFTKSADNKVNSNFGCAITANIAAMVANPADLAGPRPSDPADVQRRETTLGKYRAGTVSSSAKDDQAGGAVSTAIQ